MTEVHVSNEPHPSWWTSAAGLLTVIGTLISSITALILAINAWHASSANAVGPSRLPDHSDVSILRATRNGPCEASETARPGFRCTKFSTPVVEVNGQDLPIDACLHFASRCGPPLWQTFCEKMGYDSIGSAEVGDVSESFILGDQLTCKAGPHQLCASPTSISCFKHA